MTSKHVIDQRNKFAELGYSTVCLWYLAQPTLRLALEQSLRVYLKREPHFRLALDQAAKEVLPPPAISRETQHVTCAALLFAVWERGDAGLRAETQEMIRLYIEDYPESLASFREVIQLHEENHARGSRFQ